MWKPSFTNIFSTYASHVISSVVFLLCATNFVSYRMSRHILKKSLIGNMGQHGTDGVTRIVQIIDWNIIN